MCGEAVGGGERRRVGGTGAAWACERLRSSSAGEVGSRAGGGAVESFGRGGGLEWRAGGAARCTGEGAGRQFREEEEKQ